MYPIPDEIRIYLFYTSRIESIFSISTFPILPCTTSWALPIYRKAKRKRTQAFYSTNYIDNNITPNNLDFVPSLI